jgi:hypothetical protein
LFCFVNVKIKKEIKIVELKILKLLMLYVRAGGIIWKCKMIYYGNTLTIVTISIMFKHSSFLLCSHLTTISFEPLTQTTDCWLTNLNMSIHLKASLLTVFDWATTFKCWISRIIYWVTLQIWHPLSCARLTLSLQSSSLTFSKLSNYIKPFISFSLDTVFFCV